MPVDKPQDPASTSTEFGETLQQTPVPTHTSAIVGTATPSLSSPPSLSGYQLGALLGRGGMGDILLGRDPAIGRDIAVKRLRTAQPTPDAISRFLREAKIQARLEHPSIVPVHAMGTDDNGLPFFTMKRISGVTLGSFLEGSPSLVRALRIFVDVCIAVEFAHSRGVVHRDLKPQNVMIGDFGEVYVLDWGLARILDEIDATAIGGDVMSLDGETQTGALLGTPGYMAPEQIEAANLVGTASDVYALGSILFELLAGERLHTPGNALIETLSAVTDGPAARQPARRVPPELDALALAALSLKPKSRPTAKELVDGVQKYLDGDRDIERRNVLVTTSLTKARALLDAGNRADAMQAAGHALALDPQSADAVAIVQSLMFSPPKEQPPALAAELVASEVAVQRRQGKAAMFSFAAVLIFLAVGAANGVANVRYVLGVAGYVIVLAAYVFRVTQRRSRPWQLLLLAAANTTLAALLSRTYGSLMLTPAITCIMAVSLTSYPLLIDRKWAVLALLFASWIVPVVLELAGVIPSTFALDHGRLVLSSEVMSMAGPHTLGIMIGTNLASIVVIALFASALATSRRNALRQTEITAWHLKQLLPLKV
ncbi:MAG TPA: serine/threonine-protein kinase [Kofleriaceae bacterium]|jgi:serine/threonine-protein kinase